MCFHAALRLKGIDISLVGSTVRKGKFVAEHLLLLLLLLLINGVFYSPVFMGFLCFCFTPTTTLVPPPSFSLFELCL